MAAAVAGLPLPPKDGPSTASMARSETPPEQLRLLNAQPIRQGTRVPTTLAARRRAVARSRAPGVSVRAPHGRWSPRSVKSSRAPKSYLGVSLLLVLQDSLRAAGSRQGASVARLRRPSHAEDQQSQGLRLSPTLPLTALA